MNYLYGDSTTSQLKSNFLEFLRDALDFCVFVLQADARMKQGRVQIRLYGEEAEAELGRLERFVNAVQGTVTTAVKGAADSPTSHCAERLTTQIAETHRQSIDGIRRMLAEAVARIETEENATRDACVNALALLLAPHDPPDTAKVTRLGLLESGQYDATHDGKAEPALEWTLELGIPDGHPWSAPMRVDRIAPHLEIKAPQLAGWITKEVKVKPQRIERFVVTEIVEGDEYVTFELRTEPTSEIGFDFHVDFTSGKIGATRIGPADDASVGGFDLAEDDVAQITDLANKLRESLGGLERIPNIVATFEGADFRTLPEYIEIAERMVTMMTPIVREISDRSLTPNELVLRRLLGNDRREEIFVAKATLREKLQVLPEATRALFDPLRLDPALPAASAPAPASPAKKGLPAAPPPAAAPAPAPAPAPPPVITVAAAPAPPPAKPTSDAPMPIRSELPPSVPPPPMRHIAPPMRIPPPPSIRMTGSGSAPPAANTAAAPPPPPNPPPKSSPPSASPAQTSTRTLMPTAAVPPPASPPKTTPDPEPDEAESSWGDGEDEDDDTPQLEVGPEIEMSTDGLFEAVPESARNLVTKQESPRNEVLVSALKKILTLSKNGRGGEAYHEYANLFSSGPFGEYKPDDQRQALKLMVLAKNHPADRDAVSEAFKAALPRIEKLIELNGKEPADLELFGVTQLELGEPAVAATAFQTALDIERSKNPQSDLIASLMRRVSQL